MVPTLKQSKRNWTIKGTAVENTGKRVVSAGRLARWRPRSARGPVHRFSPHRVLHASREQRLPRVLKVVLAEHETRPLPWLCNFAGPGERRAAAVDLGIGNCVEVDLQGEVRKRPVAGVSEAAIEMLLEPVLRLVVAQHPHPLVDSEQCVCPALNLCRQKRPDTVEQQTPQGNGVHDAPRPAPVVGDVLLDPPTDVHQGGREPLAVAPFNQLVALLLRQHVVQHERQHPVFADQVLPLYLAPVRRRCAREKPQVAPAHPHPVGVCVLRELLLWTPSRLQQHRLWHTLAPRRTGRRCLGHFRSVWQLNEVQIL
eukprot:Rhum_TRINITY_DN15216_c3_g6::Rhum_TRINITY_DN15216_c3_g6_i4::g.144628::m.144628